MVLGSGGARGYAHIGVIEVLERYGIHPDFIVGSSAGSIVGSIYASGKNAQQLREIAMNMKANDVRDVTLDLKAFDGKKLKIMSMHKSINSVWSNLKSRCTWWRLN